MTLFLYAQPYNIDAEGFYFRSAEEYAKLAPDIKDSYGNIVEEFEIQFIDGDDMDCELAKAWRLSQCNFTAYFEAVEKWDESQKLAIIIAVGECGYELDAKMLIPTISMCKFLKCTPCAILPSNLLKMVCSAISPRRSNITSTMTPSPVTSALITVRPSSQENV